MFLPAVNRLLHVARIICIVQEAMHFGHAVATSNYIITSMMVHPFCKNLA